MVDDGRPRYCLRGLVSGSERTFLLQPGLNQVGSLPSGDVVLPAKGVSRQHAVIAVIADDGLGLELRDLGSKNGTFHNGVRIDEARLSPGDVIQLGGVRLTLERVITREDALAIHFTPPLPRRSSLSEGDTSLLEREGRALLAVVERLVDLLAGPTAPTAAETAAALRVLVPGCGASGAMLGEWDGEGEPVALSTYGDVGSGSAAAREVIGSLIEPDAKHPPPAPYRMERRLLDRLYLCGGFERPGQGLLYLLVWGGADERGCTEGLIGIFLRLLDRSAQSAEITAGRLGPRQADELLTPPGYVRSESSAMRAVYKTLAELASSDITVLFEGETGVGKEYLVTMLHASSPRRGSPLVAINCAAIPAELLEAELFGIRKGVATGVDERKGRFQMAAGGTLFLDEIVDLPAALQAKLLRVLQDHIVQPLGGPPYALDARIVAATNRSLEEAVAQGRFRPDLYYRIAGYVLQVPALRQRRDDIPLLVESLIQRSAGETGKWIRGITVKALEILVAYPWPGNVRELENEARRLVYRCPAGSAIDSSMLSEVLQRPAADTAPTASMSIEDDPASLNLQQAVDRLERRLITRALERTGGNRSQAARLLGISRNGLADKLERLGISLHLVLGEPLP
ncbi:MAG TPA: sigma 54-interacting transcriptional regulator [Thermoanaerobaculia bacterium]|nr:sigma 54-interacting transcriptional regulator [Thermoanaerobaculia bacterium]